MGCPPAVDDPAPAADQKTIPEPTPSIVPLKTPNRIPPEPAFENRAQPNIVIVLIDQLRADQLGIHGSPEENTPNLDRLARGGFYFEHARAPAPWTYPSTVSLLTGLYPSAHGANRLKSPDGAPGSHWINTLSSEITTVGEYAKRTGYRTAGFVTNPYLKPASNVHQGFDHWQHDFVENWATDPADDNAEWWLESSYADSVNPAVTAWARTNTDIPALIYVHYIDVHGPWELAPWRKDGSPHGRNYREEYSISVRHTDRYVGELHSDLDEIFDGNMLFIVTADHGNHLEVEDCNSAYKEAKQSLHDFNLHVPLIFADTGALPYHGSSSRNVSLVDVVPTLLAALSLQPDTWLDGVPLWPVMRGGPDEPRAIHAEVDDRWVSQAVVEGEIKWINLDAPERARFEYHWVTDPHELAEPLGKPDAAQAERFRDLELQHTAMELRAPDRAGLSLEKETLDQLRALGYVE